MLNEIYLDNSSTTPVSREVAQAMEPYWAAQYGNPSSPHMRGLAAEKTLNHVRRTLSKLLTVQPQEVYFTGSGTEANNIAIQGITSAPHFIKNPGHIITTAVEHPSVLNVFKHLESLGWDVTYLPVNNFGSIDLEELQKAIKPDTKLVSIMLVNNEMGTIYPIEQISKIINLTNKERQTPILFHCDAIQALGKISMDIRKLGVDLLTLSGHKLFGPKGIGMLYVKQGTPLRPIMFGGNQERSIRPGTENIPAIVGLTKAIEIALQDFTKNTEILSKLRSMLVRGIDKDIKGTINSPLDGAPHILNVRFHGIRGEVLVHFLEQKHIFVAMGAACASRQRSTSHVLQACGLTHEEAQNSIRISLSPTLTSDDIAYATSAIAETVDEIRKIYT